MEWVFTTNEQLETLARNVPWIGPFFLGVFSSDPLPTSLPETWGLIVNLDPEDLPGTHWIALWQANPENPIEWMDSLNLPPQRHRNMDIYLWTSRHSPHGEYERNTRALQAFNSKACGMYCLHFLWSRAQGDSYEQWLGLYSPYNFVENDAQVGRWFKVHVKRVIKQN